MFSEPTINDHLDKTRRSLTAEIDVLQSSLARIYSDHAARGVLTSSMTVQCVWAETVKSGIAGIETALRELQRTIQSTKLDPKELRDHTVNELENFRLQLEAIGREKSNVVQVGMEAFVDRQSTKLQEDFRYMIRQFDVGFFQPSQGEAKMTTNNSISVHSLVGNISQNSPNSTQSTNIDVGDLRSALASFSEAIKTASLPSEKLDEILSDVATIHAQLSKQSPSGGIIQEASKSIRNVIEGIAGGLLTPQVSIAAVALFRAVGLA
jgi:enamine deaminase RidA (YjgF/YER057c/UK114 family)